MRKISISLCLAITLSMFSGVKAFATPEASTLEEGRQKYQEIQDRMNEVQTEIDKLTEEMEPLQSEIDKNNEETEKLKGVIENTEKDINQCKEEITVLDAALGERVNEMYKSGDLAVSYLSFILESDSTSDFFKRIQNLSVLIGKDKEAVLKVVEKREEFDAKKLSLEEKQKEIDDLNAEIQTTIDDLNVKKDEQQELADKAKAERDSFDADTLAALERADVAGLYEQINDSTSMADIQNLIKTLENVRDNQLKSQIVKGEIEVQIKKAKDLFKKKQQALGGVGVTATGSAGQLIAELNNHIGKAYVWGATGPANFDCSGLTSYVYRKALGVEIGRTTYDQIKAGIQVSQANLQPGDLVFPNTGHVGIYIGNGKMIHAPSTGDVVKVSNVYAFYTARRVLN